MIKRMLVLGLALAMGVLMGEEAPSLENAQLLKPQENYARIARRVANMLPAKHVTQQPLNDLISQRAWTNLVTMYDYNHAVFLKSDLDQL